MASLFVFAVAADGEVGVLRLGGEGVEKADTGKIHYCIRTKS